MVTPGRFVAFEGGEGSGKSTQAAILAARLGAVLTREPGGTPLGEAVRSVMLGGALDQLQICPRAELFLVSAARAQHLEEVIVPALVQGRDVVCDRFSGSTLAYQGFGRGLDLDEIRSVTRLATCEREPDLTLLLDLPDALARERRCGQADRIEAAGDDFHARVTAGFRSLAAADPLRWALIDATGSIEEVARRVETTLRERVVGLSWQVGRDDEVGRGQ